ncbi:MAG: cytochrome c biogenesis heme-transporting ATPase CcmA [Burkholderiales bacterium]|jgi:heme exporter protein A|nr:cytochrome c biogenesis heme-transporting ATPase CcmA [Burkholderiales bacterium]
MLAAHKLDITRGDRRLFGDITLELRPGTLLLVTGSNGSGKTSLLRALCGLLLPSAGEVRWQNANIRSLREEYWRHLAYIGHSNALKDELSAAENLGVLCALSGVHTGPEQQRQALADFGLAGRERLPAKALSQGQRRRTALARLSLCGTLPLWILDEPFAALDSAAVSRMQSVVGAHLADGGMVVMTTHQEVPIVAPAMRELDLDGFGR